MQDGRCVLFTDRGEPLEAARAKSNHGLVKVTRREMDDALARLGRDGFGLRVDYYAPTPDQPNSYRKLRVIDIKYEIEVDVDLIESVEQSLREAMRLLDERRGGGDGSAGVREPRRPLPSNPHATREVE